MTYSGTRYFKKVSKKRIREISDKANKARWGNTPREDVFWSRVDKSSGECWMWKGLRNKNGYGIFHWNGWGRLAHRVAWAMSGRALGNLCLCHKCDNPSCCNPNHLFEGTRGDNTRDAIAKGRMRYSTGESCYMSKLKTPQVIEIKSDPCALMRKAEYATRFGVSESCIEHIARNRSWRHVIVQAAT